MNKLLLTNATIFTFKGNKALHGSDMDKPDIIYGGSVLINNGIIEEISTSEKPITACGKDTTILDCQGKLITSGLIDCHTHFVFQGYRAFEFFERLKGTPYIDVLKKGGGIHNTVNSTRQADFTDLINVGISRTKKYLEQGVTTIEGKSGYGLDLDTELLQLQVMAKLRKMQDVDIVMTYMGAHATPKEMSTQQYVDFIVDNVLPEIIKATYAEFVDCFCEKDVFNTTQCRKILTKAKELGLKTKIHADEIESIGGSALAAELGCISCEHLLKIKQDDINKLANSNTVCVLLPATAFILGGNYAPARNMIDSGCAVAVATDLNPGSCYTQNIPLLIALSVMRMKMTVNETLCALTLNAAAAIDRADKIGTIEIGKQGDITIFEMQEPDFLVYNTGMNQVCKVIKGGRIVLDKGEN